jgi:1-acyl-sn-glycerol-3-phosphate acyltransferase
MGIFSTIYSLLYTLKESFKITNKMKKEGSDKFFDAAKNWAKKLLKILYIDVQQIPIIEEPSQFQYDKSKSYVIVANHSSFLDIPILLANLDLDFVIMYKKELEKIPIFGKGLEISPYISVLRTNPRDAVKSLDKAITMIKSGKSLLIFPEGTRSENNQLGEFKKGATRIAYKSNADILPVKITNSYKLMPKNSYLIQKGKVQLEIKTAIPFSDYKDISEEDLLKKLKFILSS